MNKLTVKIESDIPSDWTKFKGKSNRSVQIRIPTAPETFKVSWQDAELVSDPNLDVIVIPPTGNQYPCKKDIFFESSEELPEIDSCPHIINYRKNKESTLVAIPPDYEVEIHTLEGILPIVSNPDYIVIGIKGELYAKSLDFVQKNLTLTKL